MIDLLGAGNPYMVRRFAEGGEASAQAPVEELDTDLGRLTNRILDQKYTPLLQSFDQKIQGNVAEFNRLLSEQGYENYLNQEREKHLASYLRPYQRQADQFLFLANKARNAKPGDVITDGMLRVEVTSPEDAETLGNRFAATLERKAQQKLDKGRSEGLKTLESGEWEAGIHNRYLTDVVEPLEKYYSTLNENLFKERLETQLNRDKEFDPLFSNILSYYDQNFATNQPLLVGIQKRLDTVYGPYLDRLKQDPSLYNQLSSEYQQELSTLRKQEDIVKRAQEDKRRAFFRMDPNLVGTSQGFSALDDVFNQSLARYAEEAGVSIPRFGDPTVLTPFRGLSEPTSSVLPPASGGVSPVPPSQQVPVPMLPSPSIPAPSIPATSAPAPSGITQLPSMPQAGGVSPTQPPVQPSVPVSSLTPQPMPGVTAPPSIGGVPQPSLGIFASQQNPLYQSTLPTYQTPQTQAPSPMQQQPQMQIQYGPIGQGAVSQTNLLNTLLANQQDPTKVSLLGFDNPYLMKPFG